MNSILSTETKDLLHHRCALLEPGSVVIEVGSWLGESALAMADHENVSTVYCIDTWLGNVELIEQVSELMAKDPQRDLLNLFMRNTERHWAKIRPYRWDSVNGLRCLHEKGVSPALIFIDGNHEYEQAWADIHCACRFFPKTPIVLDDCGDIRVDMAAQVVADEMKRKYTRAGWAGVIQ